MSESPGLILKETKQVHLPVTLAVSAAPGPQQLTPFVSRFQIPKRSQGDVAEYLGWS